MNPDRMTVRKESCIDRDAPKKEPSLHIGN